MINRNFDEWFSHFRETIYGYDYYTDFRKVYDNVQYVRAPLNAMNALLGSDNLERDFKALVKDYPAVLQCLPILIAVRESEMTILDNREEISYDFCRPNQSVEQYLEFMKGTGLYDLIQQHKVSNLFDYVTGVEVGLDSNARKNRGGHTMENLVESYLRKIGVKYHKEMYLADVQSQYGINLESISNTGKTQKRFDFVVESKNQIVGIEVNFYASNGSKLNETARSYKMIAEEAKNIPGFKFMWITDGLGWTGAKGNLEETFDVLDTMFCIDDLENGSVDAVLLK